MIETAKLTIDLTPELRDHLFHISEKKQVSPSSLASEILQYFLNAEYGRLDQAGSFIPSAVERRRQDRPSRNPLDLVADIQQSLEALDDYLPGFSSADPLAVEVEAIISQVEAEREND